MEPFVVFAALVFWLVSPTVSIDVSVKGDTCSNFDLCNSGAGSEAFRTCDCDEDCNKFGTCCIDADNFPLMASRKQEYQCYDKRVVTPVFVKRTCAEKFRGHNHLRNSCMENEYDKFDVLGNLLVTSSKTKVTYWNRDCAICNNEKMADLIHWTVQVVCPNKHGSMKISQSYIEKHLSFNKSEDEWGLMFGDAFVECSIYIFQPAGEVGQLRYCVPNMIDRCPQNYEDEDEIRRCSLYHGERRHKDDSRYFRNVHCALCNGFTLKKIDCVGRNYAPSKVQIGSNIVKVIFSDGKWLEREGLERIQCGKYFAYDVFWKKCRKDPYYSESSMAASSGEINVFNLFLMLTSFALLCFKFRSR